MLLQPVGCRLLQPAQLHGSLAVSAGRPSADLAVAAGGRNIKQYFTAVWLVQAVAQVPNMAVAA